MAVAARPFRHYTWGDDDSGDGDGGGDGIGGRGGVQALLLLDLHPHASYAACARGAPPPSSSAPPQAPALTASAATHICAVIAPSRDGSDGTASTGTGGGGLVLRCHGARPTACGVVVPDARALPLFPPPPPRHGSEPGPHTAFAGAAPLAVGHPAASAGGAVCLAVSGGAVRACAVVPSTGQAGPEAGAAALLCGDGDGAGGGYILAAAVSGVSAAEPGTGTETGTEQFTGTGTGMGPGPGGVVWTLVHDHRSGRPPPRRHAARRRRAPLGPFAPPPGLSCGQRGGGGGGGHGGSAGPGDDASAGRRGRRPSPLRGRGGSGR